MGFHRPITFKMVIEIDLEKGKIISIKDLSKQMNDKRKKDRYYGAQPQSNSKKDIEKWINHTFSLDYD